MTDHVVLPPETVLLSILETRLKDEFKNNVNVGIYYDIEGTQKPDNTRPVSYTHLTLPTTPYV